MSRNKIIVKAARVLSSLITSVSFLIKLNLSENELKDSDDNDQEGEDYNEADEAGVEDEHESKFKGLEFKYKD
ncbi:hypothetical protein AgCh_035749 [Apium graveolens]